MSISEKFRRMAAVIDDIEALGVEVTDAVPQEGGDSETLTMQLTAEVPLEGGTDAVDVEVEGAGEREQRDAPAPTGESNTEERPETPARADRDDADTAAAAASDSDASEDESPVEQESAREDSGRESGSPSESTQEPVVACRQQDCEKVFGSEHGMRIHYTKVHVGSDATPAYRDPDRLAEVYERCDTFEAMRDALDVDVTPATVRRYLVEHGIHTPRGGSESDDETSAASDDESAAESDGENEVPDGNDVPDEVDAPDENDAPAGERESGSSVESSSRLSRLEGVDPSKELREGVTFGAFYDAVVESSTVYDLERSLDVDRETATELLAEFDLLELLRGRISTRPSREELLEEVDERIRRHETPA